MANPILSRRRAAVAAKKKRLQGLAHRALATEDEAHVLAKLQVGLHFDIPCAIRIVCDSISWLTIFPMRHRKLCLQFNLTVHQPNPRCATRLYV